MSLRHMIRQKNDEEKVDAVEGRLHRERFERSDRKPDVETFHHEAGGEKVDSKPIENTKSAQELQNDREPAPEPSFGLYNNQAEKKCRSDVIAHAIRCLTTDRHTSACVQRSHVRQVWQQLHERGESQVFDDPREIENIEAEISRWEFFHSGKIQSRKPSELSVCYLGGSNPINNLKVLVDNGVLPQNIWAVEESCEKASEDISGSSLKNVRLVKGDIFNFMKDFHGNFDIIYFDACGTLPSAEKDTLTFIGCVFQYNRLTSPGALITNFSFPTEQSSSDSRERDQIRQLVTEYLKYRLDNTHSPAGNLSNDEDNYGDYITYQVIDSAYLYIPVLRMLTCTDALWNQMFQSKKIFFKWLNKHVKLNVRSDSCIEGMGDASEASPMWKCGFALEKLQKNNPLCKAWVSQVLPDWKLTLKLKTPRLPLLLLTHLFSHYDSFISELTEKNFREECQKALRKGKFPRFAKAVDLESTISLVFGLLYGQMAYPSFPVVDKIRRFRYTRDERQMYTDVFIFDQCRYVYQQFPSISCACFAIEEQAQQVLFRLVVDGLRKHLEHICSKDVFKSFRVASIDPAPNSGPKIPKRIEVRVAAWKNKTLETKGKK